MTQTARSLYLNAQYKRFMNFEGGTAKIAENGRSFEFSSAEIECRDDICPDLKILLERRFMEGACEVDACFDGGDWFVQDQPWRADPGWAVEKISFTERVEKQELQNGTRFAFDILRKKYKSTNPVLDPSVKQTFESKYLRMHLTIKKIDTSELV